MNINNQTIDWNAPDVLMQIAASLQNPLNLIAEASSKIVRQKKTQNVAVQEENNAEIIFSNTEELTRLIKEVVKAAHSKSVAMVNKEIPAIFDIYQTNTIVQSLCAKEIDALRISKSDQSWLFNFERLVDEQIKKNQMNLYDLSYDLAISERQLHRKIKSLLGLTPNKYIRTLKLDKAYKLIDQYVYDTISEVSYAVGYYDTHYFSKLFCKQYGVTPKDMLAAKQ